MTDKITERIKLIESSSSKKEAWEACGLKSHQGLDDWLSRHNLRLEYTTKIKVVKKQPKE
jgi:hypothetical protein